jgi:tetratricopeptide (TPR) repeat protein
LQQIDKMSKQANETDEAFEKRKAQMASEAYASLGMVHLERSRIAAQAPDFADLGKTEQSHKTAIEKSKGSESAVDFYRLGEICSLEGKVDEAISAFSKANRLAPGTVIEQYADRDIKKLKEKKSQAEAPKS